MPHFAINHKTETQSYYGTLNRYSLQKISAYANFGLLGEALCIFFVFYALAPLEVSHRVGLAHLGYGLLTRLVRFVVFELSMYCVFGSSTHHTFRYA